MAAASVDRGRQLPCGTRAIHRLGASASWEEKPEQDRKMASFSKNPSSTCHVCNRPSCSDSTQTVLLSCLYLFW